MDAWDPLHSPTSPDRHWTTANLGEAMPGVQTPLSWTLWAYPAEHSAREGAFAIGGLTQAERLVPPMDQRWIRAFHGRVAAQVEFMTGLGDRMPGTSGQETAMSVFGVVPDDIDYRPTMRRYPAIAWRLPLAHARTPARARALAAETDRWYRTTIAGAEDASLAQARATFREAAARLDAAMCVQSTTIMAVAQPLFRAVSDLIEKTGVGDVATLSGTGGAEIAVVADIWAAAHGERPLTQVVADHGFHGPLEGELSSRVWREDDAPLRRLLDVYRDRPHPVRAGEDAERAAQQAEILARVPRAQRPAVKLLLRLAETRLLIRGVAKRAFLQCFDVCRASARGAGTHLPVDDVFYLTVDELTGALPTDAQDLVDRRRARREEYLAFRLPELWKGEPRPIEVDPAIGEVRRLQGQGVSPGVVEGVARVVDDPSFAEVEEDEVLVARTTDPSWASIMFVSAALVVDIGGPLSHAAVVARELGIPCVVSTGNGTAALRSGDRVRVDGGSGTVEVLERAAEAAA